MKSFLTEIEKTVITMRFSGAKRKEIATALGKSTDAVRKIEKRAWAKHHKSYATIAQWDLLVASGESMKNIVASPIRHSLADVMI